MEIKSLKISLISEDYYMIQEAINQLLKKEDLSLDMAKSVMSEIMAGKASNVR